VIVGERQNALMIPEEAIVPQGEEFYVFKVVDGAARRVPVKIGVRRDARVEVLQGLASGDLVVTAGMRLARDGQPVRVLNAPGAPGAPAGGAKPDASKADASKADAAKPDATKADVAAKPAGSS
jgi:membrane fusion protein (multidrug efflux system)